MELPMFNIYINFSRHQFCCFTIVSLFVLDKSMAWNRCLQHPCFKNLCKIAQASKNLDSNAQHFLSDLLRASSVQSRHQLPATGLDRPWLSTGRTYRVVHPVGSRERVHMISCGLRDLGIWLYLVSLAGSGLLAGGLLLTAKEENLQRAGGLLARPAQ
jgi:hypothetical protein